MTQAGGGGRQPMSPVARPPDASAKKPLPGSAPTDPAFVFVQHAAFANIEPSAARYMGYDYFVFFFVPAPNTLTNIGRVVVPSQQALDVSEIQFNVLRQLPGAGFHPVADHYFTGNVYFTIDVSGVNPWDQFTLTPVNRIVGWPTLNQNLFASWSDAPVHLIVKPNQTLGLNYWQINGATWLLAGDMMMARVRGRWLEERLYKQILAWQL
jgi:hypothetical protein